MSVISIISFDFGIKNIGIAIGQYITQTATPLISLKVKNGIPNWQIIFNILKKWQPTLGIVGLPLNTDGTEQPLTNTSRKFANQLYKRFNLKIIMHDERFTTIEARNLIFHNKQYKNLKNKQIDAVAAGIILESWLSQSSRKDIYKII